MLSTRALDDGYEGRRGVADITRFRATRIDAVEWRRSEQAAATEMPGIQSAACGRAVILFLCLSFS